MFFLKHFSIEPNIAKKHFQAVSYVDWNFLIKVLELFLLSQSYYLPRLGKAQIVSNLYFLFCFPNWTQAIRLNYVSLSLSLSLSQQPTYVKANMHSKSFHGFLALILMTYFADPCAARDNIFRMISLKLFFTVWTNLINSNVFYNHIFIYYRNNHKCNNI